MDIHVLSSILHDNLCSTCTLMSYVYCNVECVYLLVQYYTRFSVYLSTLKVGGHRC